MDDFIKSEEFKILYPFKSQYIQLENNSLHYIDEGTGPVMLMVHGNPTWSFYYRDLIKHYSKTHRVIAVDNIGCGLSDKPQDYEYTLENHIQNLVSIVKYLDLKNITLFVHDWGGAIGFGLATRMPELISRAVIFNTAAFHIDRIPFSINLCKNKMFGEYIVRKFNAFAWPATFMTTTKKLPRFVKKGYLAPYDNFANRIAISRFVEDIPMQNSHPTFSTLKNIEDNLKNCHFPKIIIWGGKDFCFNDLFYKKWKNIYPNDEFHYVEDAGHYVVEDAKDFIIEKVNNFVS